MERFYTTALEEHLKNYNQMLFLTGPRQVGKTTLSITLKSLFKKSYYFNWDLFEDRKKILAGQENIAKIALLDTMQDTIPIIIFDEIHKYSKWKIFLKGFFDLYKD
jgi:predicted AAA+ superfamily ATPase